MEPLREYSQGDRSETDGFSQNVWPVSRSNISTYKVAV
jgi:hypothetical protein